MSDGSQRGKHTGKLNASAIILSGGTARRMGGREKGLLPMEGATFIEAKISVLADAGVSEIVIVTNRPELYEAFTGTGSSGAGAPAGGSTTPVRTVTDDYPNAGVLAALYTGLKACKHQAVFASTADTPFLRPKLVRLLLEMLGGGKNCAGRGSSGSADAVVPRIGREIEPLCAAYARRCIDLIEPCLERGEKKIRSFYPSAKVLYAEEEEINRADPGGRSCININTWEEYYIYFTKGGMRKM